MKPLFQVLGVNLYCDVISNVNGLLPVDKECVIEDNEHESNIKSYHVITEKSWGQVSFRISLLFITSPKSMCL